MTLDEFWTIIERVHRASEGDMDRKCELLDEELRRLPLDQVLSFHGSFDELMNRAYNWELWAAAYIICGGCSDDGFSDFRSTLISNGRETFENALADPESLADIDYDPETADYEGFQYVPTEVETFLGNGQQFLSPHPTPSEPSGERWEEERAGELFPRLAEKYA